MTIYYTGQREQISWGEESTYGTAVTPTEIVGMNAAITPNFSRGWQEILSAGTGSRQVTELVKGPLDLSFTLEFIPVNWKFLKYVFGSVTDSGTGPYTHTFSIANQVKSFTLEWAKRGDTNTVITLTGVAVKSARISFTKATGAGSDGFIKVSLECVAQDYTKGASITSLSAPAGIPFHFRTVKLTIDGNEVAEVNSGELNFNNTIDPNDSRYCNSTYDEKIGEPIPKTFRTTARANINIKDSTFFDLWDAGTSISGTTKLEFIRSTDDNMVFNFGTVYPDNTGVSPTNLEGIDNLDFGFTVTDYGSAIATDSEATY